MAAMSSIGSAVGAAVWPTPWIVGLSIATVISTTAIGLANSRAVEHRERRKTLLDFADLVTRLPESLSDTQLAAILALAQGVSGSSFNASGREAPEVDEKPKEPQGNVLARVLAHIKR
jgi:hypothetical protein